ncbi:MAG: holo-ACP synthase [Anaerolineales bacterium]|nr:holo-ACP synthase [Anaerolineales bacterium]
MKLVSGVDLIEIERVKNVYDRHGARFLHRIFTPDEVADVHGNIPSLAVRFAAKEAAAKALGTGIGQISWQEIEVRRSPTGQPVLFLHRNASRRSQELGITHWSISLSHTVTHAVAVVIGIGE